MNVLDIFKKKSLPEDYYKKIIIENKDNLYSFQSQYLKQEENLLNMYGAADEYSNNIRIIVISDTHNTLDEKEFKVFVNEHKHYDVCLLLGDHHVDDIEIILKYIDNNRIYGILGNHDFDYLDSFNIKNINGKVIVVNGTTILGMQGSFKYKPVDFPAFSQKESIVFLNDKPKVDLLITHDKSFDNEMLNNPSHQGLFGITYYLFKNKVSYHIHGHIHNQYKKTLLNGTKEISVFMYEYLEL